MKRTMMWSLALVVGLIMGCNGGSDVVTPEDPQDPNAVTQDLSSADLPLIRSCIRSLKYDRVYHRVIGECTITGSDALPLRFKVYTAPRTKAVVLYLEGRAEFIEMYDVLFTSLHAYPVGAVPASQTLADMPITFVSMDLAGQGRDEGGRLEGHIDSYEHFVADVDIVVKEIRKFTRVPIYLLGHSMGGLVAARYAEEHPTSVAGLALSSPMWGLKVPAPFTPAQVAQVAAAYATPPPYGLGMANRCALPAQHSLATLGAIPQCLANSTCAACFQNPASSPVCGMLGMDWAAMGAAWLWLNSSASIGCPPTNDPTSVAAKCAFPPTAYYNGLTKDVAYCTWEESSADKVGSGTFGWFNESFKAMAANQASLAQLTVPVLVLSSVIDPVVDPAAHVSTCAGLADCQLVSYPQSLMMFHALLLETTRDLPIAEIRNFLTTNIGL
jgi:alpha-beta hydrolase superfamily lysophospholipase